MDGVAASGADLLKLLRGTDIIGSKCRVTAKRSGGTFDVELARTSAFAVRNMVLPSVRPEPVLLLANIQETACEIKPCLCLLPLTMGWGKLKLFLKP